MKFCLIFLIFCFQIVANEKKVYRNKLQNLEFDKEAPQNSDLERATIAKEQGASEDQNFEVQLTPSKTDSSVCFGIKLVANFPVDVATFNRLLEKDHICLETSNLKQFQLAWKKKKESKIFRGFQAPAYLHESPKKIFFWNIKREHRKYFDFSEFPKNTFILFLWEPPIILPKMYEKKNFKQFSKIYTWDDDLVDNKKFFKFYYPVLLPMIENPVPFEEKRLCTMVASNKKNHHPKELYSERKKVIEFFEMQEGDDFIFYGNYWSCDEYRNYRGVVADKIATVKDYRFCFCYENMRDIKGYVTEKIFDAFAAGTVPIYWGAANIENFVPDDCFIDKRKFSSLEDLYSFLKNMKKDEYENYLHRIREYLKTDKAKLFSQESFVQLIANSI